MSLDDEIRMLRDQLARKLTLQNAQLRKMLSGLNDERDALPAF
ncbi:UNVERIFIED_ORG: hypothetical protein GGD51_005129 [Rhizobium esperanzae]